MDNENIEILADLNDFLTENSKESIYQFIYSQSPNGFIFELEEFAFTGQSFVVFDSNERFSEEIEDKYEKDIYTYKEALVASIKYNIQTHIKTLEIIQNLLKGI
jgi:hypothetical protein